MSSESGKNGQTNGEKKANNPAKLEDSSNNPELPAVTKNDASRKDSDASTDSFEHLTSEEAIRENTLSEVVKKMCTRHHNISQDQEPLIYGKCKLLFEKDYICEVVNNLNYCINYPIGIIVPVGRKTVIEGSSMDFNGDLYSELVKGAPEARLRSRFVAPVILFDNKFICRSGTLTVKLSALYEKYVKSPAPQTTYDENDYAFSIFRYAVNALTTAASVAIESIRTLIDWTVMSTLFSTDAEILKHLKVNRVFDLMVEYSKLYRQTVCVSSTEKEYEDLYEGVKMEELPFPGCEFFTSYHEAGRNPDNLFFNWKQDDVRRGLKLTEDPKPYFPEINLADQKNWDLTTLTQNYLKIMLSQLLTGTGGVVIHCISGWDRTPLFVSLLRLSLWADGVVHETLEYEDLTYLTIAYDWYLFGHNLPNRIEKKEEVMHFCFNFLKHITDDEFSVTRLFHSLPADQKRNRIFPKFVPGRRSVLNKISALVLRLYDQEIFYQTKVEETAV